MSDFILRPGKLSFDDCKRLMQTQLQCTLDDTCLVGIHASHAAVQHVVASHKTVYGINTGFGSLANQVIAPEQLETLQRRIVLSHACGTGELLDDRTVALILLLKINALAQGLSGVSLDLIQALLTLYHEQLYPCIPAKGSVGASGDLAPLAHLALPLLGVGEFRYQGNIISAEKGLAIAGLKPLVLGPKEGLALLNGLQVSTAITLQALF